jgi:phage replication O-like protein O
MADVQLKHGHLSVANDLYEAMFYAGFTTTHLKIVGTLIRLTYGWNKKSVRVSMGDLAACCDLNARGGGFQRAFTELVEHGVIILAQRGIGRRPSLLAINKNYETWGRFTVHPGRLHDLYRKRPESDDRTLEAILDTRRSTASEGDTTEPQFDGLEDDENPNCSTASQGEATDEPSYPIDGSVALEGDSTPERDEPLYRPVGVLVSPQRAIQTPPNSLFDETYQRRKTRKPEDLLHNSLSSESESAAPSRAPLPAEPPTLKSPPKTPASPDPLSLESVSARFPSIYDRASLGILATSVPSPVAWLAEICASLDGMGGHVQTTVEQAGRAIREFVGNGAIATPNLRQFRRYLEAAANEKPLAPPSSTGKGGARNDAAIDAWLAEKEKANGQ